MSVTREPQGAGSRPNGDVAGGSHQLDLLALLGAPLSTAARFEKFDRENPTVYEAFVAMTTTWAEGNPGRKIGIGALTERVRWELAIQTKDPEFRINNNFRAFYVRKLIKEHPRFADLFELRKSQADKWMGSAA
jgi:hypothetical protein